MESLADWWSQVWMFHSRFVIAYLVIGTISWFSEMKCNGSLKTLFSGWRAPGTSRFLLFWMALPILAFSYLLGALLWAPAMLVNDLHHVIEGGWGKELTDEDEETEAS